TRCSFEVGAHDQGAHVTYLGPSGSHFGHKESVKDTARVLGGMFDGIEFRGFSQEAAETLAKYSGVPVWNGLTDADHPTQVLADFLTAKEVLKKEYKDIKFAFVGDGHDNVSNALMLGAAVMGM
ncbi:ornithine carbamoyltransferase subunit F, partial [Streptococcus anginosus]|nr:ornithine carbamoyltransferase subunit F [Streptococcus anginosus]